MENAGSSTSPEPVTVTEPEPQQEITLKQIKEYRRLYFTVRRPIVRGCGHKLDPENQPNRNCEFCWFAFFKNHGELVQTTDEMFQAYGGQVVIQLRGEKYLKNFLKFMSTLAQWQKEAEQDVKEVEPNSGVSSVLQSEAALQ